MEIHIIKEAMILHRPKDNHPENPYRIVLVNESLVKSSIDFNEISILNTNMEEALKLASRVHVKGYIDYLLKLSKSVYSKIDEDTYVSQGSLELALAALYFSYRYALLGKQVFLISRPPGHHAGRGGKTPGVSTQGFCLLNNAAAAVLGFMDKGYGRIAILDFDAHHGNGTMEIFYEIPILQIDIHQDPRTLYPHTGYPDDLGRGKGYGFKLNAVLPPHVGDDLFIDILSKIKDILTKYSPEALVVSAGFDGFLNDGLADLNLTRVSYHVLGYLVREINTPTVIVLEGGYSIGLKHGVVSFIEGVLGIKREYQLETKTPNGIYKRIMEIFNKTIEKVERRI